MRISRAIWAAAGLSGTLIAALLPASPWRMLLMAMATGFGPVALVRLRWTPVGLVLASLTAGLPQWGAIALLAWGTGTPAAMPWIAAAIQLVCLIVCTVRMKAPIYASLWKPADTCALALIAVMAAPAIWIQQVNGPHPSPAGNVFLTRLYIAHDSFYAAALAQSARDHQEYPRENPFMSGAPNGYPSYLHCALGGLSTLAGKVVLVTIWPIYVWLITPGIGFAFLALWRHAPRRGLRPTLLLACGFFAFLAVRPDHFIFLQTQALSLSLLAWLIHAYPGAPSRGRWPRQLLFAGITIALIASHTITAAAGLALLAGQMVRLLLRRRYRAVIVPATSTVAALALFAWMNRFSGAPRFYSEITADYKWEMLTTTVFPYFAAIAVTLALTLRAARPLHPFAFASWLLIGATTAYWLFGYFSGSEGSMFFSMFNAPRFMLNGLMLSWIFVYRYRTVGTFLIAGLVIFHILFPNIIVKSTIGFIYDKPQKYTFTQLAILRKALPVTPGVYHSIITNGTQPYSIATFSGYSEYDPHNQLFALGTMRDSEFPRRANNAYKFFNTMSPDERLAFMKENNIAAIVEELYGEERLYMPNRLPPGSADIIEGPQWVIFRLRPEHLRQ